jgi:hypothetical protein
MQGCSKPLLYPTIAALRSSSSSWLICGEGSDAEEGFQVEMGIAAGKSEKWNIKRVMNAIRDERLKGGGYLEGANHRAAPLPGGVLL